MALIYIPILSYHRIVDGIASPFCVSPAEFAKQMKWLRDNGFRGVSLADAIAARAGRLSGQAGGAGGAAKGMKAFALTFDHGYVDNFRNALPVLKEHHVPAHVFLVTNLIDTKQLLNVPEGVNTNPDRDRLMTWDEAMQMKEAGMDLGSMGAAHIDLTASAPDKIREDLNQARDTFRGFLGFEADYFSYPFGRVNQTAKEMVKDTGFRAGVFTPAGKTGGMDRYSLRRVSIGPGLSDKVFQFKLSEQADTLRENPKLFGVMKALGKAWD